MNSRGSTQILSEIESALELLSSPEVVLLNTI